jgi:hypothetical protein
MALTYTTLQEQIKNTAEDDSQEFSDAIPSFIDRAETRLARELDHPEMTSHVQTVLAYGDPFVTKPANMLAPLNFYVTSNGSRIKLLLRTEEYVADYWPTRTSVGIPKYYANYGGDRFIVAPAPSSTNAAEVAVVVQPATLSAANETNFFTDKCFDALFYACMIEAYMFLKNYSILEIWNFRYGQAMQALQNEGRRTRRDDEEFPASPAGQNTLTGVGGGV